jgi:Amt family ammonium transporter
VAFFADPSIIGSYVAGTNKEAGSAIVYHGIVYGGNAELLKWQFLAAITIIIWDAFVTFVLLKIIGLFLPLREPDSVLEAGDSALHGHEVYPADVATLGSFGTATA